MRALYLLSLAFCLALTPAWAQSSVWKVSKNGQSLYLGGTCHILRPSDYPLPPEFDQAYALADRLVFEVDPAILQEPAFAMRLMAESVYKDGRTLKSVLNEEAYKALAEQGKQSNLPIEVIQKTKPGMAVMMLTLQELARAGVTQEGVDLHYGNRAHADGKPVDSLETADFQLNLIVNLGQGIENELVLYSIRDLHKITEIFDEMIQAWRNGNLKTIEDLFVSDMAQFPEVYNLMLKDRNERWIPQIEAMLQTEATEFVLVGLGHIPGEDGLIQMLQAKGYTVEQVERH